MNLLSELMQHIGDAGVDELVKTAGLDREMASKAVPSGFEVILEQLEHGSSGGLGGLLQHGAGALGALMGGAEPSLPDPQRAASTLASKLGVDTGRAGHILTTLLPLVLTFFKSKGSSAGSVLGGLGSLFG